MNEQIKKELLVSKEEIQEYFCSKIWNTDHLHGASVVQDVCNTRHRNIVGSLEARIEGLEKRVKREVELLKEQDNEVKKLKEMLSITSDEYREHKKEIHLLKYSLKLSEENVKILGSIRDESAKIIDQLKAELAGFKVKNKRPPLPLVVGQRIRFVIGMASYKGVIVKTFDECYGVRKDNCISDPRLFHVVNRRQITHRLFKNKKIIKKELKIGIAGENLPAGALCSIDLNGLLFKAKGTA